MGRRKLEMKRIEDKNSRQVTFSKRRVGLIKKARQLSVLCDIELGVVIFSSRGKLYEFCSGGAGAGGGSGSARQILERYHKSSPGTETGAGADKVEKYLSQCTNFRTSAELLQTVKRYVEEPNVEPITVPDLVQLEEELGDALMQTRLRKTQLMMEHIKDLHEKEKSLSEENEEMEKKMSGVEKNANRNEAVAGVDNLATNQINCSPRQVTLPLFIK